MKRFMINHKRLLIDLAVCFGVFLFVFLSYFIFKPLYFRSDNGDLGSTDGVIIRVYIFSLIIILVAVGVILKIKKKLTVETLLFLIFLLGVIMQLNYMLITPVTYRQHDMYGEAGHEAYAWTIYSTGKLPTLTDADGHLAYQFYHPPFNASMQALFMHICKPFMSLFNTISGGSYFKTDDMNSLYQSSEILSCFYMNISIYFGIKIAHKLKISNVFKVACALFIALFPALIIQAGQLNNDPLCVMNCFIVLYFTVKWWENHSYFNAIMIGLFTGLAMFAKLSGALAALPAVVAFICVFIKSLINKKEQPSEESKVEEVPQKDNKKKDILHIILQAVIIMLIAFPIGLWFHIYAKVRFDQPFGFVFSNLTHELYVGDYNFFERFINIFDFNDMTFMIWGHTFYNYNLPNFLIKSACFGEYSFICADAPAVLMLVFNYIFVYTSLILMIVYFIKSGKENLEIKIIAGSLILSQLLAQLYFNIKMPYGCTMDFRYIIPIILGFMILDGLAFEKFSREKGASAVLSKVVLVSGGLFIASTFAFYLFAI